MEEKESTAEGAKREAFEEANAKIQIKSLLAVHDIPRISQVYIWYRAELLDENISAGEETQEVKLFSGKDIPWNHLAFPTVTEVLKYYLQGHKDDHSVHTLTITKGLEKYLPLIVLKFH
jgi:ADP-ribose pyrophosphatase YjhB (NUDIX family)